MNILTFDIEEWAIAKSRNIGSSGQYARFDECLDKILNTLSENDIKGTFFCTGMMAKEFPQVVRKIQSFDHEIGCHSHIHTWMNKLTESEAREDTHIAVDSLEQCIGEKILSYRAPAFSICENNKWMFEILAKEGITRDASVFPTHRDLGGFPSFGSSVPCIVEYSGITIKEFPVSVTKLIGKTIVYSGGGYFRLFPYSFIKSKITTNDYSMCYFHIKDLMHETKKVYSRKDHEAYFKEPGTLKNRYSRFIKDNLGKKGAWNKLERLTNDITFMNLVTADKNIDRSTLPKISL